MRISISLLFLLSFSWNPLQAQDYAKKQLEDSPRHHEWVDVQSGERMVHCFVAYPEASEPTGAVVLIHENTGLTDWVCSAADQVAALGFIAIAPDLLSDFDLAHMRTSDFSSSDDARNALYELDEDQITQDLDAAFNYILAVPSCDGKVSVLGFSWGGSESFRYAANNSALRSAIVFYGMSPTNKKDLKRLACPVYGFYGGDDEEVNGTIDPTMDIMSEVNRDYDYIVFKGAGHAFMRKGDDPAETDSKNQEARDASWQRIADILHGQ
ncbi:MAG: dienelactone hydrolase family protein [Saprospirales bacterium]|nr:dienelactone hydrolase family protein [Saprospirales bacterium]MBK8491540.1 dienelactone hydrolase family protein [Saprospirales bacterium]